jgi:tRNA-dihydrouridine synthase
VFNEIKHYLNTGERLPGPTMAERVAACRKHLDFSVRWKGDKVGIFEMRRHYTNYFRGIDHFKPFRMRLVEAPTHAEVVEVLAEVAETFAEVETGDIRH